MAERVQALCRLSMAVVAMAAGDDSSFVPAPTAKDSQIEEPAKKTRERSANRMDDGALEKGTPSLVLNKG
ncbi:uncharacterized protein J3R85_018636 [Psidium guajava]|nr:uncharacterized protein J3R85_018636 [Psidium guajava]